MRFEELIEEFCCQLRRRQFEGSLPTAKRTAEFLRTLVSQNKYTDAKSLLRAVRTLGIRFQAARPTEFAVGNATRRVMYMVREEHAIELKEAAQPIEEKTEEPEAADLLALHSDPVNFSALVSLRNLLEPNSHKEELTTTSPVHSATPPNEKTPTKKKKVKTWKRKDMVIESINEFLNELDAIPNHVANQALDHIHAHEVVLTLGYSDTTFLFLESASKKRKDLRVIVAEGAPNYDGHRMAKKLSEAGIQTTVIMDAAIFAMMARVDQVFMGCKTLLANGGVIASAGSHLVALAAKEHATPFVVLVGLHKLSPFYPSDPAINLNDFRSAFDVADLEILAESRANCIPSEEMGGGHYDAQKVDLVNPSSDYVPPDLISLFVTDQGGVTPTYVHRLLDEYYARQDHVLDDGLEELLSN
ncbi:hypothetical protein BSKO_08149 [Bryopsis sp. KO-2023]|nr:hypothetical protein BSKO_08149 [Bryopsis sp. KO-2023]